MDFERLFIAVPQGCLQFVIVVFPENTHLLFWLNDDAYLKLSSLGQYMMLVFGGGSTRGFL